MADNLTFEEGGWVCDFERIPAGACHAVQIEEKEENLALL